jgi:hypothetical protein
MRKPSGRTHAKLLPMRGGVSARLGLIPFLILLSLCAGACAGSAPDLLSDYEAPPGSLRLAAVAHVGLRQEILAGSPDALADLKSAGLQDQDLRDGSVIVAQIHCCHGPNELSYGFAYVPPGIELEKGDVVEIRVGRGPKAAGLDQLNVVTQVRERADAKPYHCMWWPPGETLWMRAIYCDWMSAEGWTGVKNYLGQTVVWTKPAP